MAKEVLEELFTGCIDCECISELSMVKLFM